MRRLIIRMAKRSGGGGALASFGLLAVAALAAYGIHVVQGRAARTLTVSPASRSVTAGGAAHFRIGVNRRRFHGRVAFALRGLPRRARKAIFPWWDGQHMLVISTSALTPPGRYSLRLFASSRRLRRSLRLTLTVRALRPRSFQISGRVSGLQPGFPRPLNLVLRNPNPVAIRVTRLVVSLRGLIAPRASGADPCGLADFYVQQYRGAYPLRLPGHSTRTLARLRVPPAALPAVVLLNRPLDQDGCQGAKVTLTYTGRAVGP